ncbi:LysE family translocator [Sulfitobacter aestuariivivens]|uniref:LysE family translocator n=1 Tax=Sulfitobacter aestuariivivens TaxID=2766981 RepID=A0A927HE20_9RHOB|nr:LysE family translocator [Sulfitobacter aestuariivivens]MBD3664312.1 LysE family translocator [Sulfitobacter aestuariivivens]
MPGSETLIAFFVATAVFAYMPGPGTLYAAAQTISRGSRAGTMAALGLHLGGYVHVLAAAFGLALIFQAVPTLYVLLKLGGAAYLIWLGVRMFRAPAIQSVETKSLAARTPRRAFWESVTVEVLNPKTALFFLAFLPQFTDPAADMAIWLQLLVLGTIVNIMFSSADLACVLMADRLMRKLHQSSRASVWAQGMGGSILVGLGGKLALDVR